jgi:hypothetical protein
VSRFGRLKSEQIRQTIDTEQVFSEWRLTTAALDHRFKGAMSWKTVAGRDYLYRKTGQAWKALGARSPQTETVHTQFHEGREETKRRLASLSQRLDELASINRAMQIGRMPILTARLLRALDKAALIGTALDVVGTNALFVYERLGGVRFESGLLATEDIDLLFDSRTSLKLVAADGRPGGLLKILQATDRSFQPVGKSSFRATNKDGFLVDLIMPLVGDPMRPAARNTIGEESDDLAAVEIEGLEWLTNSPKVEAVIIDERGYPVRCVSPDPRSFALHKHWLSKRPDRDALKRVRDREQAVSVGELIATSLPHLRFDDPVLGAIPKALRDHAPILADDQQDRLEPNW